MTPVEELRAAADRIEQLAAKATKGPWYRFRPNHSAVVGPVTDDEDRRYVDGRDEVVPVVSARTWGGRGFVRRRSGRDLDWIAAVGPQVAGPLVEWLRLYADACQQYPAATDGERETTAALAFARAVLTDHRPTTGERP